MYSWNLDNLTKGYVSKDICSLVNRAARITAKQDEGKIRMDILVDTLNKCKGELPSVSEEEQKKHEQIRDVFENKKDTLHRPIGFTTHKEK